MLAKLHNAMILGTGMWMSVLRPSGGVGDSREIHAAYTRDKEVDAFVNLIYNGGKKAAAHHHEESTRSTQC
jgi:hypothetical protein